MSWSCKRFLNHFSLNCQRYRIMRKCQWQTTLVKRDFWSWCPTPLWYPLLEKFCPLLEHIAQSRTQGPDCPNSGSFFPLSSSDLDGHMSCCHWHAHAHCQVFVTILYINFLQFPFQAEKYPVRANHKFHWSKPIIIILCSARLAISLC